MRRARRYFRHTLSGKLLLLFIGMAVLLLVLLGGSMRHAFRDHFDTAIRPHLLQYLSYVQQDIGNPPNRQRARQLADELHMEILIHDARGDWSSRGRQVSLDAIHIKHRFSQAEANQAYC